MGKWQDCAASKSLVIIVIAFLATSILAEKCVYQKLREKTKMVACDKVFHFLIHEGWQLDQATTSKLNDWNNNSRDIMNEVHQGIGNCSIYRLEPMQVEDCCNGWTGENCDQVTCTPPCINGACVGPNTCICKPGWAGLTCEEDSTLMTEELRYCYHNTMCTGQKLHNSTVVSQGRCCDDDSAGSWGSYGGNYYCHSCGSNTSNVVLSHEKVPFRTCLSGLDCAIRIFDGVMYEYCTHCTLDLLETDSLRVKSQTQCDRNVSTLCYKKIVIEDLSEPAYYTIDKYSVSLSRSLDDTPTKIIQIKDLEMQEHAERIGVMSVHVNGDSLFLHMPRYSLGIRLDNHIQVFVTVGNKSPLRDQGITGACGNYDGDFYDEVRLAASKAESEKFGKAFSHMPCLTSLQSCETSAEKEAAQRACSVLSSKIFAECHKEINVISYMEACKKAYCMAMPGGTEETEIARCDAVGAYASVCANNHIVVPWRTDALCGRNCSSNLIYKQCGPSCKPTCGRPKSSYLEAECNVCCPGCHCPDGLVFFNKTCIQPSECPCVHRDVAYKKGDILDLPETCQQCTCNDHGSWNCSTTDCLASCNVYGPGVVETFDGEEFVLASPESTCDFILLTSLSSDLEIMLLTRHCTQTVNSVCAYGFRIRYNEKLIVVEQVTKNTFRVMDKMKAEILTLPYLSNGIYIRQVTTGSVTVDVNHSFRVMFLGRPGHLTVWAKESEYFGDFRGFCGNLNKLIDDDRLLTSGVDSPSDTVFASVFSGNQCGLIGSLDKKDGNLTQCLSLRKLYLEFNQTNDSANTVYKVCSLNSTKETICSAVLRLAFSTGFSLSSIFDYPDMDFDWKAMCREELTHCKDNYQYRENIQVCSATCLDLQFTKDACMSYIFQGCACPKALFRAHNGSCVRKSQCSCYDAGTKSFLKPGVVKDAGCQKCTCQNGRLKCDEKGCEEIICPNDQLIVRYQLENNGTCVRQKCPDKYFNQMTCADNSIYNKKCVCKPGMAETSVGTCISLGECPCFFNDVWYGHGAEITNRCTKKRCENGAWDATERVKCQATCYIAGSDNRVVTFDGTAYTFEGICSYTLVQTRGNKPGFKISFRNVACGTTGHVCTHQMNIEVRGIRMQLVDGVGIVIGNRTYSLNDYTEIGGIKMVSTTLYNIIIFEGVAVYWTGGLLSFIQVSQRWENKLEGLCGTFDFNSKNDFLLPDESLDTDPAIFGPSWNDDATQCFDNNDKSLQMHACLMHPERLMWAQAKCSVIKSSEIFAPCRSVMSQSHIDRFTSDCEKEACSCMVGGECSCLCDAIAHFEAACAALLRPAKWRHQNLCPVQCDGGATYRPNGRPCHLTCLDVSRNETCDFPGEVEGCFCPNGYVWHETRCMPQSECPCYSDGYAYERGTVIVKDCMECTCTNGIFNCTGRNCSACSESEFACKTSRRCIPLESVCNNFMDCYDGSDEDSLICESKNCSSLQYKCVDSGECLPLSEVCDGIGHCRDHSDEADQLCKPIEPCPFKCEDGRCLSKDYTCDGFFDCSGGEDEMNCTSEVCEEGFFQCRSPGHVCIMRFLVCDGHDDCGDGTDELGCTTPKTTDVPITFFTRTESTARDSPNPSTPLSSFSPTIAVTDTSTNPSTPLSSFTPTIAVTDTSTNPSTPLSSFSPTIAVTDTSTKSSTPLSSFSPTIAVTDTSTNPSTPLSSFSPTGYEASTPISLSSTDSSLPTEETPLTTTPIQESTSTSPPVCLSPWTTWTMCPRPCQGVSTRQRFCQSDVSACNCSQETLRQAEACTCNTVTPSTNLTASTSGTTYSTAMISSSTTAPCTQSGDCDHPQKCVDCVDDCEQSCKVFRTQSSCNEDEECRRGCACPEGQLKDDSGFCIQKNLCPCYDIRGKEIPHNSVYIDENTCQVCTCADNGTRCKEDEGELELFYEWGDWSAWSSCSANCGFGLAARQRTGVYQNCKRVQNETKICRTDECYCVTEDGEIVGDKVVFQPDKCHICSCQRGNLNCSLNPDSKVDGEWESWGAWSRCEQNCRLFSQSRCRYCQPAVCGGKPCEGESIETRPCGDTPCCNVFTQSMWSNCSQDCGESPGYRVCHKVYADEDGVDVCGESTHKEECGQCSCRFPASQWTPWTQCSAGEQTCGWGKRYRSRRVSKLCHGVKNTDAEDCFLGPCECPGNTVWSNNSLCQRTCDSEPEPHCYLHLQGGCVCPPNLFSNGSGCVSSHVCSESIECSYKESTYKDGQKFECDDCHTCQCCRGKIVREKNRCPDPSECNLITHRLVPSANSCCSIDCVPLEKCSLQFREPDYVTVGNCTSVSKVRREYCKGLCTPSTQHIEYIKPVTGESECQCCTMNIKSYKPTEMKCKDTTTQMVNLPVAQSCTCKSFACSQGIEYL